ncbi:hypothetical protein B566_EDAN011119 [Ephemera danica]|nr:hypothetical protein B566_EDAN011119 [Ephemera danica]
MSDFEGLESCDKLTKDAIINFSYHLTVGNMDEAFKAIKTIKSETVWENMAKMCVKTNRLDVAMVCFGHMGHARGTWGVKEAMRKEPELEAQVAMLAIQLDLNEEAESLYQQCKRYDLLNKFYQDTGQWDKAIQIAEQADRIHLRTTYYNYAKHLEFLGDLNAAVNMYEKSDTHRFEVPRMLVDEPNLLENYMKSNTDSNMLKWWAQYLESTGDMEGALKYYEIAGDTLALVRVHCYCENYDLASKVASETGDKAACYHLARQLENSDNIMLSIQFFTKAQAYGNAIRLCKEQGADEQVWSLALMASPQEQREAAVYFENIDRTDRAVRLYQRAGMLHKALDLAFKTQQYNALQSIATELDADSDPALVLRCARFFMENKLYDKAVDLLVVAKQFSAAVDLCLEHNVTVTEELAERMTVSKRDADDVENIRILVKMAECAQSQSNYHLAAKKFTQAGDKVRAMKALLKSGDTEKIVFFTNVSRQKDIYVMAANYLQSLDWRNSPDVMKNIIAFYSKGRALDLLAAFYASRCLARSMATYKDGDTTLGEQQRTAEGLARRLSLVKRYVELCRLLDKETDTAIAQCREFLQVPDLEESVRRGDVFAMMVAHHLRHKNLKAAAQVLDEMRATGTNPSYYIDVALLRELGMPGVSRERQNSEEIKEEEEIPEEQPNLRANFHSVNGKAFAI